MDTYGAGGVVEELEKTIAELLGKPAALFFVTGVQAQLIALKIHCDRKNRQIVLWHPTAHAAVRAWPGRAAES